MPTPFGIRRRLKSLLGIKSEEKDEKASSTAIPKAVLFFTGPNGKEQTAKAAPGTTVAMASMPAERPIATGCSDSTCGTCHVEILEGAENLSAPDGREAATLKQNGHPAAHRLACRATLEKGTVKVKAFELM